MPTRLRFQVLLLMSVHGLITGCGFIIVKAALFQLPPFAFGFWRFAIGFAALLVFIAVKRKWPRIEKRHLPQMLVLSFLAVPANQLLYLYGLKLTVPSHASLLYGSTVIFALLLSSLMGYERLTVFKIIATVTALTGLVLVVSSKGGVKFDADTLGGDLVILAGVIVWAAYTVLGKPVVKRYGATSATIFCLTVGSIMGIPFLIPAALAVDYSQVTWIGWAAVTYGGLMMTVVAFLVWFALLKRIDPSQTAILTTPQPVIATTLSVIFFGEMLGISLVVGGLLVIGGVILMELPALLKPPVKKPSHP